MTFDELMKALNPEQAGIVTEHISTLTVAKDKTIGELNTQLTAMTGEVDTLKKAKPAPEQDDVLKGASPEIKAMFEKMQGTVTSLVAAQEESLAKERFAKVKAIPAEETELLGVLKSASPAVLAILEKASAAIEAGLVAKGTSTAGEFSDASADDYYKKLEKSARAIMTTETGITFEKAFTKAAETDPETYRKYAKGAK